MTNPFPFIDGSILNASELNSIGESETWTPSFSYGVTIGNGTVAGTYQRVNDFVIAQARFTIGSTSVLTNYVRADLPIAASDAFEAAVGTTGFVQDTSAGTYWAVHGRTYGSAATYLYGERRDSGTEGIFYSVTLAPITFASGDLVQWQSVYRVGT